MVLKKAVQRAAELGIEYLVVASNTGKTAWDLYQESKNAPNLKIVCITHQIGFREPGEDEMGQEMRSKLTKSGVSVYTGTHLLGGIDRALRKQFNGVYPAEIVANTLRMFSQGVKVGVEIAVMALDSGLIPFKRDVIALGGTSRGADSAIVIRPAHSDQFFKSQIKEIITMPY